MEKDLWSNKCGGGASIRLARRKNIYQGSVDSRLSQLCTSLRVVMRSERAMAEQTTGGSDLEEQSVQLTDSIGTSLKRAVAKDYNT